MLFAFSVIGWRAVGSRHSIRVNGSQAVIEVDRRKVASRERRCRCCSGSRPLARGQGRSLQADTLDASLHLPSIDCQGDRDRVAKDAVTVLGLGEQRVGAGAQAESVSGRQRPNACAGLRAVAQECVAPVVLHVEGHLGNGAVGIAVRDIAGGQCQAAAGGHWIGAGGERTDLRLRRQVAGNAEVAAVERCSIPGWKSSKAATCRAR